MRKLGMIFILLVIGLVLAIFYVRRTQCNEPLGPGGSSTANQERVEAYFSELRNNASKEDIAIPTPRVITEKLDEAQPTADEKKHSLKNVIAWVRDVTEHIRNTFRDIWEWTPADTARHRHQLFVEKCANNSDDSHWNEDRCELLARTALLTDLQNAPGSFDTPAPDPWYDTRTTRTWRTSLNDQIRDVCPQGIFVRVACGQTLCGLHAMNAQAAAWSAANRVNLIVAVHNVAKWVQARLQDLKDWVGKITDWIHQQIDTFGDDASKRASGVIGLVSKMKDYVSHVLHSMKDKLQELVGEPDVSGRSGAD